MKQPRLLRHARGSIQALSQNAAHNIAARHALVHYPSDTVYSFIPKNGCTTLRVAFAMGNGTVTGAEDFHWIHANNGTFRASLRELASARATFVVLRCPFRRLASAFLDKIVARSQEFWTLHRHTRDGLDAARFTFAEFAGMMAKTPVRTLDIHWRPQVDFLVYEDYDRWFALERLSDALPEIEAMLGHEVLDSRNFAGHDTGGLEVMEPGDHAQLTVSELSRLREEGRVPAHADLYDDALREVVTTAYAKDVALYAARFGAEGLAFPKAADHPAVRKAAV